MKKALIMGITGFGTLRMPEAMWMILQHPEPDDFVIGTGESYSVKDFVEATFGAMGLDWKEYVEIDPRYYRPKEDDLWIGYPEETNAPYGLAKKMLLVQAQAYRQKYGMNAIYLLAVNLYGPGDNFDPQSSHIVPALIKKVYEARLANAPHIETWGSGTASREFHYVEDTAEGVGLATEKYDKPEAVNLDSGTEITIKDLTKTICRLMDYKGEIHWDPSKPDGQPRPQLDVSHAEKEFGLRAKAGFEEGLKKTINWHATQKEGVQFA